jgi:hypothetical protein
MNRLFPINLLLVPCLTTALGARGETPREVARHFLPPNTQLAELYTFDYSSGHVSSRSPAILTGHIISPESDDVVLAYYSPRVDAVDKTLFITLLHRTSSGYQKAYEVAYYSEVLLVPSAMQVFHLDSLATDVFSVIHGRGAAAGGEIDVFRWDPLGGLKDLFPANGSVNYFSIVQERGHVKVRLGFGKAMNEGPFQQYVWNGRQFVKSE